MQSLSGLNDRIDYQHIKNEIYTECNTIKNIALRVMPWMVVGTIFLGMGDQALISSCVDVASLASKCMYGGTIISMAIGIINGIKIAEPNFFGKPKVTILKEELDAMRSEILFFRQMQENLNRQATS